MKWSSLLFFLSSSSLIASATKDTECSQSLFVGYLTFFRCNLLYRRQADQREFKNHFQLRRACFVQHRSHSLLMLSHWQCQVLSGLCSLQIRKKRWTIEFDKSPITSFWLPVFSSANLHPKKTLAYSSAVVIILLGSTVLILYICTGKPCQLLFRSTQLQRFIRAVLWDYRRL